MPYPTNNLSNKLEDVDRLVEALKATLQNQVSTMAAGSVNASTILGVYVRIKRDYDALGQAAAIPGIAQHAKDEKNDQNLDIVAEFTALRAEMAAVVVWIDANFPAAGGYIQSHQIAAGVITERPFTSGQTAGLRAVLNSVIAAID